jgi:hypothetical protein
MNRQELVILPKSTGFYHEKLLWDFRWTTETGRANFAAQIVSPEWTPSNACFVRL